jgi:hypothetical protein
MAAEGGVCPMWTYLLKEQGTQYVKIGVTAYDDPVSRFVRFGVYNPRKIELIGLVYCLDMEEATQLEAKFHREFRKHWARGEWFELPSDVIEEIRRRYKGPKGGALARAQKKINRMWGRRKRRYDANQTRLAFEEQVELIDWPPSPESRDRFDHHAAVLGLPESMDVKEQLYIQTNED